MERRSLIEKIAHLSMRLFLRIYGLFLPTCELVKTLLKHKKAVLIRGIQSKKFSFDHFKPRDFDLNS